MGAVAAVSAQHAARTSSGVSEQGCHPPLACVCTEVGTCESGQSAGGVPECLHQGNQERCGHGEVGADIGGTLAVLTGDPASAAFAARAVSRSINPNSPVPGTDNVPSEVKSSMTLRVRGLGESGRASRSQR